MSLLATGWSSPSHAHTDRSTNLSCSALRGSCYTEKSTLQGDIIMAQRLTSAEVKGLFEKCNNWGKWGKEDQRGALNYITEKQVARAGKLVQSGETASCAL